MKNNEYVDVRITGSREDLVNFIRACAQIEFLGRVGASREVKIGVDGDGAGQLTFLVNEEGQWNTVREIGGETEDTKFYIGY